MRLQAEETGKLKRKLADFEEKVMEDVNNNNNNDHQLCTVCMASLSFPVLTVPHVASVLGIYPLQNVLSVEPL